MAQASFVTNANHAALTYSGNGAAITNISRANISAGTANQILVNNPSGLITSLAVLDPARGGTGVNTSSLTGIPRITAGTWSASAASITDADLAPSASIARTKISAGTPNHIITNDGAGALTSVAILDTARGGTNINSSSSTGLARITAGTWSATAGDITNADISAGAAIARTKIAAGSVNQIIVNDGAGALSSIVTLNPGRGGTGADTSASTGIPRVTAGTWSVTAASITNTDISAAAAIARTKIASGVANHIVVNDGAGVLSSTAILNPARGGTGVDTSVSTGIPRVTAGTWVVGPGAIVNADISAGAAIDRTKIANGTANHVVVNSAGGVLSSEPQLSMVRGGTGQNFSAVVGPVIPTITAGVMSATQTYSANNNANALALRDASGNFSMNTLTANTVTAPGDLTLNPSGKIVTGDRVVYASATTIPGGFREELIHNLMTPTALATTIATYTTTKNTVHAFTCDLVYSQPSGLRGRRVFYFTVKNIAGTLFFSSTTSLIVSSDPGAGASFSLTTFGQDCLIRVTAGVSTTYLWCMSTTVVSQTFA